MIQGNGSTSLKKSDAIGTPGKTSATGYTQLSFAHKAAAGVTGFNLSSLTVPPEMTANGFSNPTGAQLGAANLLFYRNNLKIVSSARGPLIDKLSYDLGSSTQINFLGFTALEGEIFTGTVTNVAQTGLKVVDATATPATGVLTAGTTDFNIGNPLQTNKYPTRQIGAVMVYKDGFLQVRNTSNSSVVLDGNYYEVDNGGGSFTVIRFNTTDVTDANIVVVPNGLLSERPDGSMMAVIESVQGQVNSMAAYVASLSGTTATTITGAAPSNVDLKAFGDRVLTLESNRARIDIDNAWTAGQTLVGKSNGVTPSSGQVGETQTFLPGGQVTTTTGGTAIDVYTFSIPAGNWLVTGHHDLSLASGATFAQNNAIVGAVLFTDNANTVLQQSAASQFQVTASQALNSAHPTAFTHTLFLATATTFKVRIICNQSAGTTGGTAQILQNGSNLSAGVTSSAYTKIVRLP